MESHRHGCRNLGVKTLSDEQATHLAQIDSLEQELFDLRGEIAGGRHVPPGVRVLQLVDNPESRWAEMRQAALDRLKNENEALLKRLRELGASSSSSGPGANSGQALSNEQETSKTEDLVPRASWELVNREKMELEEVVKQKEKRLLRLKEVSFSFDLLLLTVISSRFSRSTMPKVPNFATPLPPSLASSYLSALTAKYAQRRYTTSARRLRSSLHEVRCSSLLKEMVGRKICRTL